MAIEISAQFAKFAQFAADSIARGEKGGDAGAVRRRQLGA